MEQATRRRNNHDTEEFKINEEATKHYAAYIDSIIKIKKDVSSTVAGNSTMSNDCNEDFRLFKSSVPGYRLEADAPRQPRRRRVSSSSSDSDLENERLQEASVDGFTILAESSIASDRLLGQNVAVHVGATNKLETTQSLTTESESTNSREPGSLEHKKKKKKKKKHKRDL